MRVVQIEPGPMPTFTASAPASISACVPSRVATLPATTCTALDSRLIRADRVEHALRMAMRGVDDDEIDAGIDQPLGALEAVVADAGRGRDAQAALLVLAGVGVHLRLLDVLHRDQADAAVLVVDDQQLLDAVLVQQALGLLLSTLSRDGDEPFLGHQLVHRLVRIGGEAHVAIGEDADQLAVAPAVPRRLDHRNAGDLMVGHQLQRIGQRRVGMRW